MPYVYSIKFKNPETGMYQWYIGSRYSKSCCPADLWINYFTSSNQVKKLIAIYGKESFTTKIVKICESKESALSYEALLIRRSINFGFKLGDSLLNKSIPNKSFPTLSGDSPFKNRKAKEWMSSAAYESWITTLKKPKSKESTAKMVNTRKTNNTYYTGEQHKLAKTYKLISPAKTEYIITGKLKHFCEEHAISWQMLYANIDAGQIPTEINRRKYKNLNRLTPRFWNTLGWEIISEDNLNLKKLNQSSGHV